MIIICVFYLEDEIFRRRDNGYIYLYLWRKKFCEFNFIRRYLGIIEVKNNNGLMYMYFINRKERLMNDFIRFIEFFINF